MNEHRVTRKDMRQPDAFQTFAERAAEKVFPHVKKIVIVVAIVLLGAAVAWTVNMNKGKKLEALNAKFSSVTKDYEQAYQLAIAGEEPDWKAVQTGLEALLNEAAGSRLYPIVLQYIANTYIAMGKYDAALGPLNDLEGMVYNDPQKLALVLYTKGKALELSGDQQGAMQAYNEAGNVVPNPLGEFLEQEAKRLGGPSLPPEMIKKYTAKAEPEADAE